MIDFARRLKRSRAPAEEAASWQLRLLESENNQGVRASFEEWLTSDRSHGQAYEEVSAALLKARLAADTTSLAEMREQALSRWVRDRPAATPRRAMAAAFAVVMVAGLSAIIAGGLPLGSGPSAAATQVYQTGIGETRRVRLADGSSATLDTQSRIAVAYSARVRKVSVERGQVLFAVVKDPNRPFHVEALRRDIQAIGTQFNVRLDERSVSVALLEGSVRVSKTGARSVILKPLQLLISNDDDTVVRRLQNPNSLTSWSVGRLVFDNRTVAEAIREMNRYRTAPIVVVDPILSSRRISGSFQTGQSEAFVEGLSFYYPIEVHRHASGTIELRSGRSEVRKSV